LDRVASTKLVNLKFLHPKEPSTTFSFPRKDDIMVLPHHYVLTVVDPKTPTGRTYTLHKSETLEAIKVFHAKCKGNII